MKAIHAQGKPAPRHFTINDVVVPAATSVAPLQVPNVRSGVTPDTSPSAASGIAASSCSLAGSSTDLAVDLTSQVKANKRALDVVSGGSGMAANVSLSKRSRNRNHNSPKSHVNRVNRRMHKCLEEWTAATGEDLVQRAWNDFCIHPHDFHCMDVWAHQGRCLPLPECFFGTPHLLFNKQRDILELMMPHPKREHERFQKFAFIFRQGSGTILEDCFKCHLSDSNDRGSRDW